MNPTPQMNETSSQQNTVSLAIITTSDGRTVRDHFELTRLGADKVALRALSTGRYLSAQAHALSASGEEIGESEMLTITTGAEGTVTFQFLDGSGFLSAPAGEGALLTSALVVGAAERFTMEEIDPSKLPESDHGGCCGAWTRTSQVGPLWHDQTHRKILTNAIKSLRDLDNKPSDVKAFLTLWDKDSDFSNRVQDGLLDADSKDPWRGRRVWGDIFTWHDHFFNPKSVGPNPRRNYYGGVSNAATEGRRYFNQSVYQGMRIHAFEKANQRKAPKPWYLDAAYYLGLSLHFFTDLTQPMHASNFANVYGENGSNRTNDNDLRHRLFEKYVENRVVKGDFDKYDPLAAEDLATNNIDNIFSYFDEIALDSSKIFDKDLLEAFRNMKDWSKPEDLPTTAIDESLGFTLKLAHKRVARYLLYWYVCTRQTWDHVDPTCWYRILEPTMNYTEWIGLYWGKYMRYKGADGNDLMFFLFNPDGTWSIGCKNHVGHLWISPYGEWTGSAKIPPDDTRFRFVPNGRPGSVDDKVWIFENVKHEWAKEIMAINQQAILARWEPVEPETQLFKLLKMGKIEDERIKARWPTTAKFWYGEGD